ncbi:MAG TPA: MATE family efflux transporter, partial [Clostridia bacterium]|nr:MATE family efflux transporter [Clostridia bacterium]
MSKNENRKILKLLITVGLPIAIQNLLSNGVNLLDNFMVGSLSEDALTAVSMANRSYFIFIMLLFGLVSGIGIFSSQYYGSKEISKIHSMMGIGFSIGVSFAVILTLLISIFPEDTVRIFIKDENVIKMGTEYLKIAVLSFIPTSISMVFQINLRSVRMTKIPMMTSIVAVLVNGFLNYILIFGKLGFSALGVKGAAIATVAARIVELVMVMIFVFTHKNCPLKGTIKTYFSFDISLLTTVLKRSLPVVMQEGLWAIGTSVYFIAYGSLNSASVAAAQVSMTALDIYISLFIGLGNGAGVMVGNLLGEKQVDKAWKYSSKIILYQIILSIPFAVLFALSGSWITSFLNFSVAG